MFKTLQIVIVLLFLMISSAHAKVWQPAPGHTQIPLWADKAPDGQPALGPEDEMTQRQNLIAGQPWNQVANVVRPTMTVYSPKEQNTGAAVVVFPGGGYKILAIDLEGTEVCDWLVSKGITCILLKYRVPNSGPHWDETCQCHVTPKSPLALMDAQRALGLVRFHAVAWNIDPKKIGVLGFSAGGHLVAALSTHFEKRLYQFVDKADEESCRPDFAIALYPGHMSVDHKKDLSKLNPDIQVTGKTPPTFLLHSQNDPINPVEYSLLYFAALREKNVPVEMHIFTDGGHAFGLRRTDLPITTWPDLVATWLQTIGIIK